MLFGFAVLVLPAGAGAQAPDYRDRQRLEAAVTDLSSPDARLGDAGEIMADLGLTWAKPDDVTPPPRAFERDAGAVIELVDIRLLLTQIAIQTGSQDHVALVRAQGDREHDVILLRGGHASLADIVSLSSGTPARNFVVKTPHGTQLTLPLAIWSDSGLTLAPGDHLILDRPSGSFVANLGWLDVSGGAISGTDGMNIAEPGFRPFVMTAGTGWVTAHSGRFQSLGFGDAAAFGGFAIANTGLQATRFASHLIANAFDDVHSLALIGTTGSVLQGNQISGSSGPAVLLSNAREAVVAANTLTALTGAQALRVTKGSAGVEISTNLVSGMARVGLLIDQDSTGVVVLGNLVAGHLTAGIGVERATCVAVTGNLVAANGGTGVSLGAADAVAVSGNAILFNGGSGVLVRDQSPDAHVHLSANVLIGNRDGLRGATTGNLTLDRNNLEGQVPRLFAGDLAVLTADWLRHRQGKDVTQVTATPVAPCKNGGA